MITFSSPATQKVFTDPVSVGLALRMINAFNKAPEPTWVEVKDPLGERVLGIYPFPGAQGFNIPVVVSTARIEDVAIVTQELADNPDVVLVLVSDSFREGDVQWIVSVMKDRASARKLTGER